MDLITRLRQKLSARRHPLIEADAVVLSVTNKNRLIVQVLPAREGNFVVEFSSHLLPSPIHAGQRIRVKYDPVQVSRIEITSLFD